MTLRDLKIFLNIIKDKIENGLELDTLCLKEFEKLTKSKKFYFFRRYKFYSRYFQNLKNIFGKDKFK